MEVVEEAETELILVVVASETVGAEAEGKPSAWLL